MRGNHRAVLIEPLDPHIQMHFIGPCMTHANPAQTGPVPIAARAFREIGEIGLGPFPKLLMRRSKDDNAGNAV